jgi:hypothetical protein
MMGLGEVEWRVMRERIFPPFEQQHDVSIRGIQVEAPDAVKKLIAMHRAQRMEVDLITQDVLWLAPLVEAGLVEDLSSYRDIITEMAIPQLVQVGEMNGRQYFMPYRPNVKIAYYNEGGQIRRLRPAPTLDLGGIAGSGQALSRGRGHWPHHAAGHLRVKHHDRGDRIHLGRRRRSPRTQ